MRSLLVRWCRLLFGAGALLLAWRACGAAVVGTGPPPGVEVVRPSGREGERSRASVPRWQVWREQLSRAHAARRAGDRCEALSLYDAVASAPWARALDAEHAALWVVRLRLQLGELSAALTLCSLIDRCANPALLARSVRVVEQYTKSGAGDEWTLLLRDSAMAARVKLQSIAAEETGEGERARRWLRSLRREDP